MITQLLQSRSENKKSFCIVCYANYCRGPVVEILLKARFKDNYEFFSAGISPIPQPNMDSRSLEFLQKNNIKHDFHTPKRINSKMLNYFDKFLAVDFFVLNQLNNIHPKYKHKFHALTAQFSDINILDPFQLDAENYMKVMNDIKHISESINLEEY